MPVRCLAAPAFRLRGAAPRDPAGEQNRKLGLPTKEVFDVFEQSLGEISILPSQNESPHVSEKIEELRGAVVKCR